MTTSSKRIAAYTTIILIFFALGGCGVSKKKIVSGSSSYAYMSRVMNFYDHLDYTPESWDNSIPFAELDNTVEDLVYHLPNDEELTAYEFDSNLTDEFDKILTRKLVFNGFEIPEFRDRKANDRIAFPACKDGSYVIYYGTKFTRSIIKVNFIFFREHEFAHIKLGHVTCSRGLPTWDQDLQNEVDADCEAAKTLNSLGPYGQRVVDFAIGTLLGMNDPRTSTHPRSVDRAKSLLDTCK